MLDQIKLDFQSQIKLATSSSEIEDLRVKFIGKNGLLTEQMKIIGTLPTEERKAYGSTINDVKSYITREIDSKKTKFSNLELIEKLNKESIDITISPRERHIGVIHPISRVIAELSNIFESFGFNFVDGPEIEDEWHNFSALNIKEGHPARQMHDTFYIQDAANMLLRTHTSNVQIRSMNGATPPFRTYTIGKTFRSDSDSTHSPMFHQLEVIYVDKKVTIGNLKYCMEQFLQKFFNIKSAPIRLRASHFPFTEPSMEVDVKCDRTDKALISIGKGDDWIEVLGSGMIHPKVLENCLIDSTKYQGFAIGVGVERLAMLKYNISDVRKLYDGDIRWLQHYGF